MATTKTRLTKAGNPVMGTSIDVQLTDDSWITVKVVGKSLTKDNRTRDLLVIHPDGGRDWIPWGDPDGVVWRPCPSSTATDQENA